MWLPRRANLVFLAMVVADSSRAASGWTSSSHAPSSSTFVSLSATATPTLAEPFTTTTSSEIIPREVLFGNPTYASPSLSPDGKYLAYLAPNNKEDNVLNVFVRSMMDSDDIISDDDSNNNKNGRAVTQDKSRGIRSFQWAEIDPINPVYSILYVQDQEGDENFHLYCVPLSPEILGSSTTTTTAGVDQVPIIPVARDLTPGDNVKVSSLMTNKRYPHELLVATNERDSSCFDMYRISHFQTDDPVKSLDTQNPGNVVGWGTEDESFEVRFALVRNQKDSSSTLQVRNRGSPSSTAAATTADASDSDWKELITFPYGEEGSFVDFCKDGTSCYITSTLNRDTKALLQVDLQTGATIQEIFSTDQCDVGGIMLDEDTKVVRMVSYNIARRERVFFDEELERDFQYLKELGPDGEVSIASQQRMKPSGLWPIPEVTDRRNTNSTIK